MENLVGFAKLESILSLSPVQPLTSRCCIGTVKSSRERYGFRTETFTPAYQPVDTTRGHFEFGLKYDDLNFEWLSRFFSSQPSNWIEAWIDEQPNSAYARRTAFLFEWFTGKRLPFDDTSSPTFVPALDPRHYLTATEGTRNRRWRVFNNLPGTPEFCPLVRITPELRLDSQFDLPGELAALDQKFGADLLMRSAAWLTFNESRATFTIEKESDRKDDIKRFAAAMQAYCGRDEKLLSDEGLTKLQNEILGSRALRRGIRRSPVFVGTAAHHDATVVRYIAPDFTMLPALMKGLQDFESATAPAEKSQGAERNFLSILRASALAFGFVYIHPMSDGNGRIHRLLINDTLIRDGLVPLGVILPVSSTIVKSSTFRGDYEKTLDIISARMMSKYAANYRFGAERTCEDGVVTDFHFAAYDDAAHVWRFPDLTAHCAYLYRVIRATVMQNMTEEASFLALHDEAKLRLKRVFEVPNLDADAIVRSLRENQGRVSNQLLKRYPQIFANSEIAAEAAEAINSALENREQTDSLQPPTDDHSAG